MKLPPDVVEKFHWSYHKPMYGSMGHGCWCWIGKCNAYGYGRLWKGKTQYLAHRISYQVFNGPIPVGLLVRHNCDNRSCVNPSHLEIGTYKDNSKDMADRNRSTKGEKSTSAKLTWEEVRQIRKLRKAGARGIDLAVDFDVSPQTICDIHKGRGW